MAYLGEQVREPAFEVPVVKMQAEQPGVGEPFVFGQPFINQPWYRP